MYWAFIFILGGVRQPQPSEIVIQPHCIENAWNACQRLLGHQDWHIVLVLNFVLPEFFYTISSISFILNVSLWSEVPLHNNREKNHIIMYNNRMCSHYILVSGDWCAESMWLNETDLVIITEMFNSDICYAWKYTYFKRNSVLYRHVRMHKLEKIFYFKNIT